MNKYAKPRTSPSVIFFFHLAYFVLFLFSSCCTGNPSFEPRVPRRLTTLLQTTLLHTPRTPRRPCRVPTLTNGLIALERYISHHRSTEGIWEYPRASAPSFAPSLSACMALPPPHLSLTLSLTPFFLYLSYSSLPPPLSISLSLVRMTKNLNERIVVNCCIVSNGWVIFALLWIGGEI